jgi:hypothetical protein
VALRDWWGALTGRVRTPEPAPLDLPRVPTGPELLDQVDAIEADILAKARQDRISGVVAARVSDICGTARDVIPRLDRLGGGTRDAHSVMATVTSYLPEALGTYLRLPRGYADTRPVAAGKTSLMVLVDQLDLLSMTMDKILDAAARRDVDALIAHGRFLAEKFGTSSLDGGTLGTLDAGRRRRLARRGADRAGRDRDGGRAGRGRRPGRRCRAGRRAGRVGARCGAGLERRGGRRRPGLLRRREPGPAVAQRSDRQAGGAGRGALAARRRLRTRPGRGDRRGLRAGRAGPERARQRRHLGLGPASRGGRGSRGGFLALDLTRHAGTSPGGKPEQ